ncbi:hypothetical protein GGP85_002167 [Salinibacter ruber]|nr:hypothetical protein [Salinibacter ruber]MCS3826713.1 hypothetical protein [Salinibacter ruber]MCS4144788.1 hypothetical protein [Salinibacter ruber]
MHPYTQESETLDTHHSICLVDGRSAEIQWSTLQNVRPSALQSLMSSA